MPMRKFAMPDALATYLGPDVFKRFGKMGCEQVVHDFADSFFTLPAVNLLASGGPARNDPVETMNDDVGTVQDARDFIKPLFAYDLRFNRVHISLRIQFGQTADRT